MVGLAATVFVAGLLLLLLVEDLGDLGNPKLDIVFDAAEGMDG